MISLHASSTDVILGKDAFNIMKKGVILLNSARGELIEEKALIDGLSDGTVSHAWIDAFCTEPYKGLLVGLKQVLLTPHVSTYTLQCRREMEEEAVRNLMRDLSIEI